MIINGRGIARGTATGRLLVSPAPLSFLSGVDPESGVIIEEGHPLKGESIAGTVFAFPFGKGSTVGSYVMYALARNGKAPAAIINEEAEPIIVTGAIIAHIPMVDRLETGLSGLPGGETVTVDGEAGTVSWEA